MAYVLPHSLSLALGTKMNEKLKSASPSVMQMKNQQKAISIEEILDVISQLEKGDKLLTCAVMLDSLILTYIQSVIMLIEVQKGLSQELKCLCRKTVVSK